MSTPSPTATSTPAQVTTPILQPITANEQQKIEMASRLEGLIPLSASGAPASIKPENIQVTPPDSRGKQTITFQFERDGIKLNVTLRSDTLIKGALGSGEAEHTQALQKFMEVLSVTADHREEIWGGGVESKSAVFYNPTDHSLRIGEQTHKFDSTSPPSVDATQLKEQHKSFTNLLTNAQKELKSLKEQQTRLAKQKDKDPPKLDEKLPKDPAELKKQIAVKENQIVMIKEQRSKLLGQLLKTTLKETLNPSGDTITPVSSRAPGPPPIKEISALEAKTIAESASKEANEAYKRLQTNNTPKDQNIIKDARTQALNAAMGAPAQAREDALNAYNRTDPSLSPEERFKAAVAFLQHNLIDPRLTNACNALYASACAFECDAIATQAFNHSVQHYSIEKILSHSATPAARSASNNLEIAKKASEDAKKAYLIAHPLIENTDPSKKGENQNSALKATDVAITAALTVPVEIRAVALNAYNKTSPDSDRTTRVQDAIQLLKAENNPNSEAAEHALYAAYFASLADAEAAVAYNTGHPQFPIEKILAYSAPPTPAASKARTAPVELSLEQKAHSGAQKLHQRSQVTVLDAKDAKELAYEAHNFAKEVFEKASSIEKEAATKDKKNYDLAHAVFQESLTAGGTPEHIYNAANAKFKGNPKAQEALKAVALAHSIRGSAAAATRAALIAAKRTSPEAREAALKAYNDASKNIINAMNTLRGDHDAKEALETAAFALEAYERNRAAFSLPNNPPVTMADILGLPKEATPSQPAFTAVPPPPLNPAPPANSTAGAPAPSSSTPPNLEPANPQPSINNARLAPNPEGTAPPGGVERPLGL